MDNIEVNSQRVRLQWTDDSRTQVMAVSDPEGPFIMNVEYEGCLRYSPKTEWQKMVEKADHGELPLGHSPEFEQQFSYWNRGYSTYFSGGFSIGAAYYPPTREILILDYWNSDDGNHSCVKRLVVDGVLYNIPRPIEPPKEDDPNRVFTN